MEVLYNSDYTTDVITVEFLDPLLDLFVSKQVRETEIEVLEEELDGLEDWERRQQLKEGIREVKNQLKLVKESIERYRGG